jgi:hypothetical protein
VRVFAQGRNPRRVGNPRFCPEGTDTIVEMAQIDASGPTGTFVDRHGPLDR